MIHNAASLQNEYESRAPRSRAQGRFSKQCRRVKNCIAACLLGSPAEPCKVLEVPRAKGLSASSGCFLRWATSPYPPPRSSCGLRALQPGACAGLAGQLGGAVELSTMPAPPRSWLGGKGYEWLRLNPEILKKRCYSGPLLRVSTHPGVRKVWHQRCTFRHPSAKPHLPATGVNAARRGSGRLEIRSGRQVLQALAPVDSIGTVC